MKDQNSELIRSAAAALSVLTKVRCVESYPLPQDVSRKNIFSWPNSRYIDEADANLLRSRGVEIRDSFVGTFSVGYEVYDEMRKIDINSVREIERVRATLDVFQAIRHNSLISNVTAAWDSSEFPDRSTPVSTSDTQAVNDFSKHKDSFLIIHREGMEKRDIKLRPYALPAILERRPDLLGMSIGRSDIREFTSTQVDRKGRKNRNIVFNSNREYLDRVLFKTVDSVEKLIDDPELVDRMKELQAHRG